MPDTLSDFPPLTHISGACLPLGLDNVDTDQVIPARFLKGTSRQGLGQHLFNDLRYEADGAPNLNFVLNDPQYAHAKVLVAGQNFGCGSSREHAPWALKDYGFEAVLAVGFADIFKNNALKNGLLPIALPETVVLGWLAAVKATPSLRASIDLAAQTVVLEGQGTYSFEISPFYKRCLLGGVDEIGYTLTHLPAIEAYELARA